MDQALDTGAHVEITCGEDFEGPHEFNLFNFGGHRDHCHPEERRGQTRTMMLHALLKPEGTPTVGGLTEDRVAPTGAATDTGTATTPRIRL